MSYTFSLPGREHLIALWSDRIAADHDPGVTATLTLPGFAGHRVTGIDVLHGFQQPLVSYEENGDLVVEDLLVKNYPVLLRVAYAKEVYLPLVSKDAAPWRMPMLPGRMVRACRCGPCACWAAH